MMLGTEVCFKELKELTQNRTNFTISVIPQQLNLTSYMLDDLIVSCRSQNTYTFPQDKEVLKRLLAKKEFTDSPENWDLLYLFIMIQDGNVEFHKLTNEYYEIEVKF